MEKILAIKWNNDKLILLDQTQLPNSVVYEELESAEGVWEAIRFMKVRGAPAIGVAAAYGLYLGIKDVNEKKYKGFYKKLKAKSDYLASARLTAVNLFLALERMENKANKNMELPIDEIKKLLLQEAVNIHQEDEEINKKIGENLLTLLEDGMGILTHCNAGALATTKYGTATAPIYELAENTCDFSHVDESASVWA